ncbi:hypothetical protein JCM6882_002744 [Rhodosporidiobolus microsporus]
MPRPRPSAGHLSSSTGSNNPPSSTSSPTSKQQAAQAQQARRRSSAQGALGHGQPGAPKTKMAVLAAANRLRDATGATVASSSSGAGGALGRRSVSGAQQAPLVVESQRYEEWMKIATDNKITSTNTWNLALIDYFHDMSLLRNGDDNSINFQKASCTLDGCVKIWTSRVDSVANETGKLLSGLGEDARNGDVDDDLDDDEQDGDDDDQREQKRAKKRAARSAPTLADSFSKLRIKSFDLEFTVDPLFKKTSADFDEGGAAGLLMNHLSVDGGMRVVFDAGDARLEMDEEDPEVSEGEREEMERREREEREREGEREVPISELFKCFSTPHPGQPPLPLPQRAPIAASDVPDLLAPMHLCPSLHTFSFSADGSLESLNLGLLNLDDDDENEDGGFAARRDAHLADDDEGEFGGFADDAPGAGEDFGGGFDDPGTGGEVDFFADEFTPQGLYESGLAAELQLPVPPAHFGGGGGGGYGVGAVEPFDPRHSAGERDLAFAMSGEGELVGGGEGGAAGEGGLLEYFDKTFGAGGGKKGWAGPEHWKMMRRRGVKAQTPAPAGDAQDGDDDASPAAGPAKKKRAEKAAFSFDFSAPPPLSAKELFAPAAPKSSITAAATAAGKKKKAATGGEEEDFTLPADFGFKSSVLLRLFLKPKMTLRMRRRLPASYNQHQPQALDGSSEGDVQFWAQAGMGGAPGEGGEGMGMGMGMGMEGEEFGGGFDGPTGGDDDDFEPPPFDTQWLASGDAADEDGDGAFDDDTAAAERDLDDLAAASQAQGLKRVRVEQVQYAKRAKRVDVKRLKESIWRELEEVVIEVEQFPKDLVYDPSLPAPPPAKPSKKPLPKKKEALVPVVSSLRKLYPKEKMDEISTSYMFICLLHLANEKGLRIQTPAPGEEDAGDVGKEVGEEVRRRVGGLDGLRVLKEVNA